MLRSYKFAMVTCSDGSRINPQRSFEGLMELVTPNKRSYVARHGYEFVDASDVLDKERPPSWSKILAVKKNLPHYDWVFWNDAVCVCVFLWLYATRHVMKEGCHKGRSRALPGMLVVSIVLVVLITSLFFMSKHL
jgi:hypothetical protein